MVGYRLYVGVFKSSLKAGRQAHYSRHHVTITGLPRHVKLYRAHEWSDSDAFQHWPISKIHENVLYGVSKIGKNKMTAYPTAFVQYPASSFHSFSTSLPWSIFEINK